jgi:hypothetical protein
MGSMFFVVILFIFAYNPLSTEISTAAEAEEAPAFIVFFDGLFPFIWIFLTVMLCVVLLYVIFKENS